MQVFGDHMGEYSAKADRTEQYDNEYYFCIVDNDDEDPDIVIKFCHPDDAEGWTQFNLQHPMKLFEILASLEGIHYDTQDEFDAAFENFTGCIFDGAIKYNEFSSQLVADIYQNNENPLAVAASYGSVEYDDMVNYIDFINSLPVC